MNESEAPVIALPPSEFTHAYRTALRRVARSEPVGDLSETLGLLYLHDLVEDVGGTTVITTLGQRMLDAYDTLGTTRRLPRPAHALPPGWRSDGETLTHPDVDTPVYAVLLTCDTDATLVRTIRETAAMLDLMQWEQGRRVLARAVDLEREMPA